MTDHKTVYAALAAAQMEMGKALKDSTNPAFKSKYADLASVMDACLPALNKHGIAVFQPTVDDDSGRYVKTILAHASGETVECRVPLIVSKNDMQGYGSAVTYARRYGLMGMAGIAPEDDDGNAAAKAPPSKAPAKEAHVSTEALRDAWRDSVMDGLPDDATPKMKAQAFALAICMDFAVKTLPTLEGRWNRHKAIIDGLKDKYPDLHEQVVDAFEMKRNEITDDSTKDMAAQ
jgi:hypothetical protein